MQTFIIGFPRGELLRRLGRNPLVRASDRLEAIATLVLFALAVALLPVVTTVGIALHHDQATLSAQQAKAVHRTTARAIANSSIQPAMGAGAVYLTQISWDVAGVPRVGSFTGTRPLTIGDEVPVWVDAAGGLSHPPLPQDEAATVAVVIAVLLWSILLGAALGGLRLLSWTLDRRRSAQWDRELRSLANDDGGRADRRP